MPLEIRELHIKVKVGDQGGQSSSADVGANSGGAQDKDAIISECVEKVLQILRDKLER